MRLVQIAWFSGLVWLQCARSNPQPLPTARFTGGPVRTSTHPVQVKVASEVNPRRRMECSVAVEQSQYQYRITIVNLLFYTTSAHLFPAPTLFHSFVSCAWVWQMWSWVAAAGRNIYYHSLVAPRITWTIAASWSTLFHKYTRSSRQSRRRKISRKWYDNLLGLYDGRPPSLRKVGLCAHLFDDAYTFRNLVGGISRCLRYPLRWIREEAWMGRIY